MYKNTHYISAGAGSGKTTKLVNIISKLVTNGQDPSRMILTTYTEAAATAFREKARAKLISDGCFQGAVQLDAAQIGTLHALASTYIKRYWHLLGMAPDLTPMDEASSDVLMNRTLDGILDGKDMWLFNEYAREFGLPKNQSTGTYDYWKRLLRQLFGKMQGYGFTPDNLNDFKGDTLKLLKETFTTAGNKAAFAAFAESDAVSDYTRFESVIDSIASSDSGVTTYRKNLGFVKWILSLDPSKVTLEDMKEMTDHKWGRDIGIKPKMKSTWGDGIAKGPIGNEVENLRMILVPSESAMIFTVAEKIIDIAGRWMDEYKKAKKDLGVIDYSDMEKMFLELLSTHEEVKADITKSIDYLFVDEFQDSNPIQARIYDILSNCVAVQSWLVGDQKQAIYGFTGSDSALIAQLSGIFPEHEDDGQSITGSKKDAAGNSSEILPTSWRSVPSLVTLANEVFKKSFAEKPFGYERDLIAPEKVELSPAPDKDDPEYDNILHVILSDADTTERRASAMATFICRMLQQKEFYDAGYKPSDVAILCRSNSSMEDIAGALAARNIPVGFVDKDFLKSAEVQLILCILKLSAGISSKKTRAELRKLIDDESLQKLVADIRDGSQEDRFWGGLEQFCKEMSTCSILERIDQIVVRFDIYDWCGRWGNAAVRRGNIDTLRSAAQSFLNSSDIFSGCADVRGFLSYVARYNPDARFDDSIDGVKVLTYHKSKGLEWKIVILYDLFGELKERISIGGITLLGEPMDPSSMYVIPELPDQEWVKNCVEANPESKAISETKRAKDLGEEKRLLYVGVTRAGNVLVTIGNGYEMPKLNALCPTSRDTGTSTAEGMADIWGIPGCESRIVEVADEPELRMDAEIDAPVYSGTGLFLTKESADTKRDVKYHSPSKYVDEGVIADVEISRAKDFGHRMDIAHPRLEDNEYGDCIHHIYAVCRQNDHEGNVQKAERTLKAFGIGDGKAAQMVADSIDELYSWLTSNYGPADTIDRELPFRYSDEKGNVFSGNMDMVWHADGGCVLVDYKTFSGRSKDIFDRESKFWAGHYASQQATYAKALEKAGMNVLGKILYYPVEGLVIRLS